MYLISSKLRTFSHIGYTYLRAIAANCRSQTDADLPKIEALRLPRVAGHGFSLGEKMLGSAPVCRWSIGIGVCQPPRKSSCKANEVRIGGTPSLRILPKWVRVYVWKHTSLLSGVYVAPRDATAKTTIGTGTDTGQDTPERRTLS